MPLFSRGPSIPSGWVAAPGDVQAEIFLVWQEDELPAELKDSPGYVPFTLSPGAEDWVRGMAEIKELDGPKEKIVIGRPRPAAAVQHRPLLAEPAPPSAVPAPMYPTPIAAPAWDTGIAAKEWIRRQAPRAAPDVAVRTRTAVSEVSGPAKRDAPHSMPAIGGSATRPPDATREKPAATVRALPDIGASGERAKPAADERLAEDREKPRRVPDIGAP
jgi:hypothetical protein